MSFPPGTTQSSRYGRDAMLRAGAFLFRAGGQGVPVKPRPLYRSLSFCSGILVFAFLLFAHIDSHRFHRQLVMHGKGHGLTIENAAGRVLPAYLSGFDINPHLDLSSRPLFREHLSDREMIFPKPVRYRKTLPEAFGGPAAFTSRALALPHWLLFLILLIPWLLLLHWRHRRQRRHVNR